MSTQIDMGDHGWKHPDIKDFTFGSEKAAWNEAKRRAVDPKEVFEVDTRPEIWRVAAQLVGEESIWEEGGVQAYPTIDRAEKWPEGRTKVFVVTGGSEGLYLHVEMEIVKGLGEPPETKIILLAKTLEYSIFKWRECWMSAARIAWKLGA